MDSSPQPANPILAFERTQAWVAPVDTSGDLPVFLTSFVGREDELALGTTLLQRPDIRLLTLTGPGGIGKTRLAIAIADARRAQFRDGVRFVSLVSVQDPAMVMMTVAAALGLREFDKASVDDVVTSALEVANLLLVVDNFEHVMDAAPALTSVLSRCRQVKIMVTSRSLLRVQGEHAIPVPPLSLPRTRAMMTREEWIDVPVIKLFIERAEAVDPSLVWNLSDIRRLVEICERLDGLPLAIELAATRMRHFTLAEINDRLNDLLPLLVDGSRDHPSRLQTMRSAIGWSHDLLPAGAQGVFRRASVFRGGFTLDAIAEVSGNLEVEPSNSKSGDSSIRLNAPDLLTSIEDRLAMLIDASLLMREEGPVRGTTRYRMLETIREYAWEQLELHDEAGRARRAHATFFTTYAVHHEIDELIPEQVHVMDQLIAERDNLRSALAWLLESSDRALFGRLVAALGRFWLAHSSYQEGRDWFERALALQPHLDPADAARILVSLGMTEIFQDENDAAETHLTRGVTACRELGDPHSASLAFIGLAGLAIARGDGERSIQLLEESLETVAAIPDGRLAGIASGWVSINLAVTARAMGNGRAAERHIEDALDRFRAEQFQVGMMMALGDLGDLARDRSDWSRALSLYQQALSAGRADQAQRIVTEVIESVGIVAAHSGQLARGATLLGAAEGLRERIGLLYRQPRSRSALEEAMTTTHSGLSAEAFSSAWNAGRNLSMDQAIADVLDLSGIPARSTTFALTARESEILRLLATGMTNRDIADTLFISVRTVEHHVANVYRKLGVRTRSAATSAAIAAGMSALL